MSFDIVTNSRHWTAAALMFLKVNVENEIWKAIILEPYGKHQGIRLLDSNNQLLASSLIQQKLGVEAQFPLEALVRRRQIKSTSNGQCHRKNVIERASPEKDVESTAQDMTFSPEKMFSNTATVVYFKSSQQIKNFRKFTMHQGAHGR